MTIESSFNYRGNKSSEAQLTQLLNIRLVEDENPGRKSTAIEAEDVVVVKEGIGVDAFYFFSLVVIFFLLYFTFYLVFYIFFF